MKHLRNILTVILLLAMIGVGVLFALQNEAPVPLDLLVYTFPPHSLALWVLAAFGLGGVAGLLMSSAILLRSKASLSTTKRQLARVRAEMDKLRTQHSENTSE